MITRQIAQDACAGLADVFTPSGDAGTIKTVGSSARVYLVGRNIEGWYPMAEISAPVWVIYRQRDRDDETMVPDSVYSEPLINRSDAADLLSELRDFQPKVKREIRRTWTS